MKHFHNFFDENSLFRAAEILAEYFRYETRREMKDSDIGNYFFVRDFGPQQFRTIKTVEKLRLSQPLDICSSKAFIFCRFSKWNKIFFLRTI